MEYCELGGDLPRTLDMSDAPHEGNWVRCWVTVLLNGVTELCWGDGDVKNSGSDCVGETKQLGAAREWG